MPTSFDKTWQCSINYVNDNSSNANNAKDSIWHFFAMLTGNVTLSDMTGATIVSPTGLWVVDSSCDGTTAGTAADGVNRWGTVWNGTTAGHMSWASPGSAHSWMVIHHTTLGIYICMDMINSQNQLSMTWSTQPFTGGTTTARPTSTREAYSANWHPAAWGKSTTTSKSHGAISTDGSFWWGWTQDNDGYMYTGCFGLPLMETHGVKDTVPWVMWLNWNGSSPGAFGYTNLHNAAYWGMRDSTDKFNVNSGVGPVVFYDGSSALSIFVSLVDPVDGQWPDQLIYIFNSFPQKSIRGRLPDLRWAPTAGHMQYEPYTGTVQSTISGNIWLPTNQAIAY